MCIHVFATTPIPATTQNKTEVTASLEFESSSITGLFTRAGRAEGARRPVGSKTTLIPVGTKKGYGVSSECWNLGWEWVPSRSCPCRGRQPVGRDGGGGGDRAWGEREPGRATGDHLLPSARQRPAQGSYWPNHPEGKGTWVMPLTGVSVPWTTEQSRKERQRMDLGGGTMENNQPVHPACTFSAWLPDLLGERTSQSFDPVLASNKMMHYRCGHLTRAGKSSSCPCSQPLDST